MLNKYDTNGKTCGSDATTIAIIAIIIPLLSCFQMSVRPSNPADAKKMPSGEKDTDLTVLASSSVFMSCNTATFEVSVTLTLVCPSMSDVFVILVEDIRMVLSDEQEARKEPEGCQAHCHTLSVCPACTDPTNLMSKKAYCKQVVPAKATNFLCKMVCVALPFQPTRHWLYILYY